MVIRVHFIVVCQRRQNPIALNIVDNIIAFVMFAQLAQIGSLFLVLCVLSEVCVFNIMIVMYFLSIIESVGVNAYVFRKLEGVKLGTE